jgi:hypothetical protein
MGLTKRIKGFFAGKWALVFALILGAATRLGFAFLLLGANRDYIGNVLSDAYYYDAVATALLENPFHYTSALHPPLYPVLLAITYFVFGKGFTGIAIIQTGIDLGSLTVFWGLCRRLEGRVFAGVCAFIYAIYPDMIYFTGQALNRVLFIFLLLLTVYLLYSLYRRGGYFNAVKAGIALGLSSLTWGGTTALIPFLPIWFCLAFGWRKGLKYLFAALAVFCLVLSPWVVRNYTVWGEFIPICTGAAGAFAAGNHPNGDGRYYRRYDLFFDAAHPGKSEPRVARELMDLGFSSIRSNPYGFIERIPNKLYYTFHWKLFTASRAPGRPKFYEIIPIFSYAIFIPAIIAGIILSFREARRYSLIHFVILSQILVVIIFFGHTRLRSQIMHYFIIFAVLFFFWMANVIRGFVARQRTAALPINGPDDLLRKT